MFSTNFIESFRFRNIMDYIHITIEWILILFQNFDWLKFLKYRFIFYSTGREIVWNSHPHTGTQMNSRLCIRFFLFRKRTPLHKYLFYNRWAMRKKDFYILPEIMDRFLLLFGSFFDTDHYGHLTVFYCCHIINT